MFSVKWSNTYLRTTEISLNVEILKNMNKITITKEIVDSLHKDSHQNSKSINNHSKNIGNRSNNTDNKSTDSNNTNNRNNNIDSPNKIIDRTTDNKITEELEEETPLKRRASRKSIEKIGFR
jgi:hypothetical protein